MMRSKVIIAGLPAWIVLLLSLIFITGAFSQLTCGGPYTNSISAAVTPGTTIGTVTTTSSSGQTVWYTIPDASVNQYLNINPYTGVITTSSIIQSFNLNGRTSFQFNVQSTDATGATCTSMVTLNVVGAAAATAVATSNTAVNSALGFGSSLFGGSGLVVFGNPYYYCDYCGDGYYCYNGQCYARVDQNYNNYGTAFTQNSYSFSTSGCTTGSSVGTVSSSDNGRYSTSSGQFAISNSGAITIASTLSAGTYTFYVTSYSNYYGYLSTATVTATVSCGSGTSSSTTTCAITIFGLCYNQTTTTSITGTVPTFSSSAYTFTSTSCSSGTTVGTVTGVNVTSYSINYGGNNFAISSAGNVTLASTLTAGTYSATVVGTSSSGIQTAVPITVTLNC
ncbi:serine-rich adhesin for platelets-like [Paramacrobiotus metropolitanus]|uniref:serine-rich adhesin for platelets-like n=1 Tax=Paramacrobiotus metropolitanus TaxID=2943436 RepID=UPI00244622F2|nr:serine-rich adhesin for platelets-like [Paramacrobiotus metropolitanus]